MYKVKQNDLGAKGIEMRKAAFNGIKKLMDEDAKYVALEADLGSASGFIKFADTNPEQFIQCGISEANMCGVAAGMSVVGYRPFIHSFAPFASRRIFDQLFLSGAYAKNNINVIATDPGITTAANGGTHTTFEDIAMMRTIPNATVCEGSDPVLLEWLVQEVVKKGGINYIRTTRKNVPSIYEEGSTFELGKANIVKEGSKVALISCGEFVSECLEAAKMLEDKGISCEVIDMFTIKPLDVECVKKVANDKDLVITVENHSIYGGLGSAVAEVIAENNIDVKFKRHGINNEFGQVGTLDYLKKAFKLDKDSIVEVVEENI